jgi:hypothetical protein
MEQIKTIYMQVYPSYESRNIHGDILINSQVLFIPDITINCKPPYVKGKRDTLWISYRIDNKPDICSKRDCESRLGMSLQPYTEASIVINNISSCVSLPN